MEQTLNFWIIVFAGLLAWAITSGFIHLAEWATKIPDKSFDARYKLLLMLVALFLVSGGAAWLQAQIAGTPLDDAALAVTIGLVFAQQQGWFQGTNTALGLSLQKIFGGGGNTGIISGNTFIDVGTGFPKDPDGESS